MPPGFAFPFSRRETPVCNDHDGIEAKEIESTPLSGITIKFQLRYGILPKSAEARHRAKDQIAGCFQAGMVDRVTLPRLRREPRPRLICRKASQMQKHIPAANITHPQRNLRSLHPPNALSTMNPLIIPAMTESRITIRVWLKPSGLSSIASGRGTLPFLPPR
jgi:hypothetical protein